MSVKIHCLTIMAIIVALHSAIPAHAWLIYHKPAFKGKVIDNETMQPIEGAVVVVEYEKRINGLGPHSDTVAFDAREAVTDKKGMFYIPSYSTVIGPFSSTSFVRFIIYKPGYGEFFVGQQVNGRTTIDIDEVFFSEEMYGKEKRFKLWVIKGGKHELDWSKVVCGMVVLPKLKTREERLRSIPSLFRRPEITEKRHNLIRLINEERERLGLQKYPVK